MNNVKVAHRVVTMHADKAKSGKYLGRLEVYTIMKDDSEYTDILPCSEERDSSDEAYVDASNLKLRLQIEEVVRGA